MPRLCNFTDKLRGLIAYQDGLVHRDQALANGLTPTAIRYRLRCGDWQLLLPNVYLTTGGQPTRRQMLIAAQLFIGPQGAIDAADACRYHGVRAVIVDESRICTVIPWGEAARSRGFVVVRRTSAPIVAVGSDLVRYVPAASAVVAATRRMSRERSVLAAMSDALQRRIVTYDELTVAHVRGSRRNAQLGDQALADLSSGVLSVAEADFHALASASLILPPLEYNVWLRLPTGQQVCVDALDDDSAFVHETNGRKPHAREDLFEDMQKRHDALTVSGLTVLHNAPRRIRRSGREVIRECEICYLRGRGRGLPPGVVRIHPPDRAAT